MVPEIGVALKEERVEKFSRGMVNIPRVKLGGIFRIRHQDGMASRVSAAAGSLGLGDGFCGQQSLEIFPGSLACAAMPLAD